MAILTPVVTPANGTTGIQIGVSPTAIFEQAIDVGSIVPTSCFLVSTVYDPTTSAYVIPPATIQNIVESEVVAQRWDLTLDQEVTTLDFGDPIDPNRGLNYRTKITINPTKPLDRNTNYAVILSRDLTTLTVFDPEALVQTGTGVLLSKGVYTGSVEDFYTVTITNTGLNNTAKYFWVRDSDGFNSGTLDAKERFIEIDQGVKLKFLSGQFVAGDTYRVRVIPADYLNDFFSWGFATANTDFEVPEDENSNSVVNLPTTGGGFGSGSPSTPTSPDFFITGITPPDCSSQLRLGAMAQVIDQSITYKSKTNDGAWNQYTLQLIPGGTAGSEGVALVGNDIKIQIEDGVSTAQQVVDAFNASLLVNPDFEASTTSGSTVVIMNPDFLPFRGGHDPIVITITFNKDIDPSSVDFENIKLIGESLIPGGPVEDLVFTFQVNANQLIITPTQI